MGLEIGKRWDALPPVAKGIISVVVVGVTGVTAYTVYHAIKSKLGTAATRQDVAAINSDLKAAIAVNPVTLSDSQIAAYVAQLVEALGGWTTDTTTVYNVFDAMKNDADVLSLEKAYGSKTITYPIGSFTGTLSATLAHDMPASSLIQKSIADINDNLAKKKITVKF